MSEFHAPIGGHIMIPGTHTTASGTTNFNIHYGLTPNSHADRRAPPREPFSNVRFPPDPDFVDRPEILAWVRDKCAWPGGRAALVGLGGVGKSQLAIQYAHTALKATPYRFVFWVHASTRSSFERAYKNIADRLELPGRDDPQANVLELVHRWLCDETHGQWTMILDNVDDVEIFGQSRQQEQNDLSKNPPASPADYLPQSCNGSMLITSRSKDVATSLVGYNRIKEVPVMNESQGLQLLRNKLQVASNEEDAAVDLLRALGCIPLVITQAAAYINRRAHMTIAGYLTEFRASDKNRESLLNWSANDLRRDESASNSVITTWQMSFERIRHERQSAADLLSLMSFFNPQGIPEWILRKHNRPAASTRSPAEDSRADRSFNEDLDILYAYSLVGTTTMAGDKVCEMHPLVQFCTRAWLSSFGEVDRWNGRFIELMAQEFPVGDHKDWAKCQQLLPHTASLYDAEPASEELSEAWAELLTKVALYLAMKWSHETAQKMASKALRVRERRLGLQSPKTLGTVDVLAFALKCQGNYEEAETLSKRVLQGHKKELGVQHLDTLATMANLAMALSAQHKYEEAEELLLQALQGYKKELGTQHLNTLVIMANLAIVLSAQNKNEEAAELLQRVLQGREKELGVQHPDTLVCMNNLAMVLSAQNKYEEAEGLLQRVLQGQKEELGVQHPHTLATMANLAIVLSAQYKYEEAEELLQRVLQRQEEELGVQHLDTLVCIDNLAIVLYEQYKYEKAETLLRRMLPEEEKESGLQNPFALDSAHKLAYLLRRLKRYEEAAELYQRALDRYIQRFGSLHPHTVNCREDFSDLQQEVAQAGLSLRKVLLPIDQLSIDNITHTEDGDTEDGSVSASRRKKHKQSSVIARIKGKFRKRNM